MANNDELDLVVVVFWRRIGKITEFLTPTDGSYLNAMGHQTNRKFATAAREWVKHKFGFNPRANARVIETAEAHVVAFELAQFECDSLRDYKFAWVAASSVDVPATIGLQDAAERL